MEKKQIISQKNIRLKMDREKNAYDKEMEKFQGLIENSIDFDLIKKCTSQQNDNPLNFYYHAYKKHSEKIQEILKKKLNVKFSISRVLFLTFLPVMLKQHRQNCR